jgi:UDP-glucose 4-epimerase
MSTDSASRTALITGGAGFIGSHLSELLLAQGWEVFVLDDLSTGSETNVAHLRAHPSFHLVVDSVLKSSVVNELVHRSDVVFHLAAAVGVRLIVEEPVHTLVTNIQGTEEVPDHCHRSASRMSGQRGLRRDGPEALGESKRMYGPTTQRRWAYAESKALDEFLTLAYHQERGLDCVIVRLFNTVGLTSGGTAW